MTLQLQRKIITDGTDTYICEARVGDNPNSNVWRIQKIDENWNKFYPIKNWQGSGDFAFKLWDVLTLTYFTF